MEELEIFKQMVGDLTGVDIWGFVGWIAYKLIKFGVLIGVVGWLLNKLLNLWRECVNAPVSKSDYERLKDESEKNKKKADDYAHMYKILKERADNGQ
jgi:hypothetical protein